MNTPEWRRTLAPALICLVLGLVVALQMKTQDKVELVMRETRVSEEMVAQLLKVHAENDLLRQDISRLRADATNHATAARLQEELELELASAGLLPVQGPGVTVSLADLAGTSTLQVTAGDILLVLNELRAGGAEAIAINGERVTDRLRLFRDSRTSGPPLRINSINMAGPVRITAIGDPQTLAASLQMRGGVVALLAPWVHITVQTEQQLVVPAASPPRYVFGRPGS